MNKLKTFFGWLFLTKAYLATLSDEQISVRAGLTSGRYGYKMEVTRRLVAETEARWQKFLGALR
jgi:hypothetical protein